MIGTKAWKATSATALVAAALAAGATSAQAAQHDYCFWDGSYSSNTAFAKCYASGTDFLTSNYAYLPYQPTLPTIYCGANDSNGNQYASFTSGNPSCLHAYGGSNLLKAVEYTNRDATTHGRISY